MEIDHDTLVGFAKTFGLFFLIAMFAAAVVYAFWPSKKDEFDRAARSVLDDEDGPMSVEERDPLTGHQTTGHEWNGITELNTRVPRAVWWAIGITHVWALVMWILLPTWPLVTTYTKGLLGIDQRELVAGELEAGERYREQWVARFAGDDLDDIRQDEDLMQIVSGAAPALWGDNCEACHGRAGAGGPGFPNLVDDAWLWGGDDDGGARDAARRRQRHPSRDARLRDAGLRRDRHPDARPDPHGRGLRPVALGSRQPGRGRAGGGRDALRRELRQLPRRGRDRRHRASARRTSPTTSGSTAATRRRCSRPSTTAARAGCRTWKAG